MERILGPEHPEVAILLVEFSAILRLMKKLPQAEPLLLRALQIREASYGPFHPESASCVQLLASHYKAKPPVVITKLKAHSRGCIDSKRQFVLDRETLSCVSVCLIQQMLKSQQP